MKRTGPTNYQTQQLLATLSKLSLESRFWKRVAQDIAKPTRARRVVNVYKINKYAKAGETIVVPGKVLSVGDIDKQVVVAALTFSEQARAKIEAAKGKTMSISELAASNPEGRGVRILG